MRHGQGAVEGFSAAMGYGGVSGVSREEGIDHVRMCRSLTDP